MRCACLFAFKPVMACMESFVKRRGEARLFCERSEEAIYAAGVRIHIQIEYNHPVYRAE